MNWLFVKGRRQDRPKLIRNFKRDLRTGFDGSGIDNQVAPGDSAFNYGLDGQAFVPEAMPTHNNQGGGTSGSGGGGNRQSITASKGGNK